MQDFYATFLSFLPPRIIDFIRCESSVNKKKNTYLHQQGTTDGDL